MTLAAYFDDGGSHEFCIVAGFIARAEHWADFCPLWNEFIARYKMDVSHGRKLKSFLDRLDAEQQGEFFAGAKRIIDRYVIAGLAVGVRRTDFDLFYRPRVPTCPSRGLVLSQFGLCFQQALQLCHIAVLSAAMGQARFEPGEKINVVLDSGNKNGGSARTLFNGLKHPRRRSQESELTPLLGAFSTETDEASPEVQAADLLAWCFNFLLMNGAGLAPIAFFSDPTRPINRHFLDAELLAAMKESEIVQSARRAPMPSNSRT